MASESVKLSGILDGKRGNVALNHSEVMIDVRIVVIFSKETFEIVLLSDSPSSSLPPETGEKKLAASARVKTWWK